MPETPLTAAGTISRLLKAAQTQTNKAANACQPGRRFNQITPGKATPHWSLGHMANTAEFIGNIIGLGAKSGAIESEWRAKFTPESFGGAPITTNPADYPEWDVVLAAYNKAFDHLVAGVAALSDADLLGPPRGKVPPPLAAMCGTLQDCVTLHLVHDSHHRGQLALLANV